MKANNFVCKVVSDLLEDDFSVLIHQKKSIDGMGGWFDPQKKEFVVAMENRMGIEILIHEYSHFLQWKHKKRYFNKLINSSSKVFHWLDGDFVKKAEINQAFEDVIELEWDCEMGAVKLIKEHKLDIDLDEYIRAANAYLMFYHIVKDNRQWTKGSKSPYNVKITKTMPTTLQPLEYYRIPENITDEQRKLYLKVIK